MRKKLLVRRVSASLTDAAGIPDLFKSEGVGYNPVDELNWKEEYPYRPDVSFAAAFCDHAIYLHFKVTEETVRAVTHDDLGPVWKDSCVEFFSCPAGDRIYYNVECNCASAVLMAVGPDRNNREFAPESVLKSIKRFGSRSGHSWEMALIIPFSAFFRHSVTSLSGKEISANFYKCGDDLPTPHFVSWNPVLTEKPDYHRPEFFGTLLFEK